MTDIIDNAGGHRQNRYHDCRSYRDYGDLAYHGVLLRSTVREAEVNIQIVNSSTGEIVATKQGLNLEASIPSYKTINRRHPVARHRRKVLCADLVAILSELRDETRFV